MPIKLILFLIFFLAFVVFCVKAYMGGVIERNRVKSAFKKQGFEVTKTLLPIMIDEIHRVWGVQGSANVYGYSDVASVEIFEKEVPMTQYDTTTDLIDTGGVAPTKNTIQVHIHLNNGPDPVIKIDICMTGARTDSQQYIIYKNNASELCSLMLAMME